MNEQRENEQLSIEQLQESAELAKKDLYDFEDSEVKGIDGKLDFSEAVRRGFGYLNRVINECDARIKVLEKLEPHSEEAARIREINDNKRLLIESARRGIYSPAKEHMHELARIRLQGAQFFRASGIEDKAQEYAKGVNGFLSIIEAIPDRGVPFTDEMLLSNNSS